MTTRTYLVSISVAILILITALLLGYPLLDPQYDASVSKSEDFDNTKIYELNVDIIPTLLGSLYPDSLISMVEPASQPVYLLTMRFSDGTSTTISHYFKYGDLKKFGEDAQALSAYLSEVTATTAYIDATWGASVRIKYNIESNFIVDPKQLQLRLAAIGDLHQSFDVLVMNERWPGQLETPEKIEQNGLMHNGCSFEIPQEVIDFLNEHADCLDLGPNPINRIKCRDCSNKRLCGEYSRWWREITICNHCPHPIVTLIHELTHMYDHNCRDNRLRSCKDITLSEFNAYYCEGGCSTVEACCANALQSAEPHCSGTTVEQFMEQCQQRFKDYTPDCEIAMATECGSSSQNYLCQGSEDKIGQRNCKWDNQCGHYDCETDGFCARVAGGGPDLCSSRTDCGHLECNGFNCSQVLGRGADQCSRQNDCSHLECAQDGLCEPVLGAGVNSCASSQDCRPKPTTPPTSGAEDGIAEH